MQAFTLAAITDAEKIKLRRNYEQSQWTVKYRSRALGQGACLKGMSRTITMQGHILAAICILYLRFCLHRHTSF